MRYISRREVSQSDNGDQNSMDTHFSQLYDYKEGTFKILKGRGLVFGRMV